MKQSEVNQKLFKNGLGMQEAKTQPQRNLNICSFFCKRSFKIHVGYKTYNGELPFTIEDTHADTDS